MRIVKWLRCRMGYCEMEYVGEQSEQRVPWLTVLWNHRCTNCGRTTWLPRKV